MKDAIYISHAWEPQSDEVLYPLLERLEKEKFKIIYDHKDLAYRGSISNFMDELAESKAIIIIVSNKYLKSEYCMYELLKIYEEKDIQERIYPIVLDEVDIAKSTDRLELVKYWEKESKELSKKIKELDDIAFIEGITDDLNLYKSIRNKIAKLTYILRDINSLKVDIHAESNFEALVQALKKKNFDRPAVIRKLPTVGTTTKKRARSVAVILPLLVVGYFAVNYFLNEKATTEFPVRHADDTAIDSINTENLTMHVKALDKDTSNHYEKPTVENNTGQSDQTLPNSAPPNKTPKKQAQEPVPENRYASNVVQQDFEIKRKDTIQNVQGSTIANDVNGEQPLEESTSTENEISREALVPSYTLTNKLVSKNTSIILSPKEVISSSFLVKGDRVYFKVINPVIVDDVVVIEKNADAVGFIVRAQSFANSKRALLELKLESVQAADGGAVPLFATLLQSSRKFEIEIFTDQTIEAKILQDANIKVKVPN